ncbi:MAG TPA: tetratricopeptide repeat-containing glycosyltransferase family protein [Pirellulales bacterium]|jgi:tetratricopeptide (TPR) repeat protein|nr:tetratricopeptide repeat-containing glycosyltransferase family protein [Pirellulales bacterium]
MATVTETLKLGLAQHQAGQLSAAEPIYRQILDEQPDYPNALHLLGVLLSQTGRSQEGAQLIERAVVLDPLQAVYHGNLGWAYWVCGRYLDASAELEQAIRLNPNYPDAYFNRGRVHHKLGRLDEAEASLRLCLQSQPRRADALALLGQVLQEMSRFAEARQCYAEAISLGSTTPGILHNLGLMLQGEGHLAEAIQQYDQALSLDPAFAPALANRGLALLSLGDFAAGWAGYEHRGGCPDFERPRFPDPPWDGSPLAGRRLLVHCEQGLGDTLQFIRYVKLLEPRGGEVIIAAQKALVPLLTQSGYARVLDREETLPEFEVHAPLLSMPRIFRTELDSVPRDVPYLAAEPARISFWGGELDKYPGFKVGIAWRGDKGYRLDQWRSIPLGSFAPLAQISSVRLLSLQKDSTSEDLAAIADRFAVVDLARSLDNVGGAFLDTAAVMKNLDLVVTCDTAIGHLAGALGVPVWLALPQPSDWRWMVDRTDSPWYPTMRLFRQTTNGDWDGVFIRIQAELAKVAGGAPPNDSEEP